MAFIRAIFFMASTMLSSSFMAGLGSISASKYSGYLVSMEAGTASTGFSLEQARLSLRMAFFAT